MPLSVFKHTMEWYHIFGMKGHQYTWLAISEQHRISEQQSAVQTIDGPLKVFASTTHTKMGTQAENAPGPNIRIFLVRCQKTFISWNVPMFNMGVIWAPEMVKSILYVHPLESNPNWSFNHYLNVVICGNHSPMNGWITFRTFLTSTQKYSN